MNINITISAPLHYPHPKRFDYRANLLRERYLLSIHAIEEKDIQHEFLCRLPITPPHQVKGPSPAVSLKDAYCLQPKEPADFKPNGTANKNDMMDLLNIEEESI
jgi:hypothetical protein